MTNILYYHYEQLLTFNVKNTFYSTDNDNSKSVKVGFESHPRRHTLALLDNDGSGK